MSLRAPSVVLLAALGLLLTPWPVATAAPAGGLDVQQTAYLQALAEARRALDAPAVPDADRTARTLAILQAHAPGEQEVVDDLQAAPPDLADARTRLDADIAAFGQASRDPDPVTTEQRLRQILAQGRYHPDQGPAAAIARFLAAFLKAITAPGFNPLAIFFILLGAGLLILVLVLLVPGLRNPLFRGRRVAPGRRAIDAAVPEYFAAAERLAAAGDYGGAVRALVAGTMELILGERSFTASPLTVRETFGRSGAMPVLRPLLQAFERSWYGHHDAAETDYAAAATAASEYRDLLVQGRAAA